MEKETNGNSHDGGMGRDEISHRISKTDSKVNTEETNHLARNRMNLNRWKELHMQKNDGAATISGGGSVTSGDSFENALVLWSNRRHQSCGGADDSITNSIESSDDDSRKTLLLDPHERIMRNSMNNTHEVTPEKEQEQEQDDTMSLPAMKVKEEDYGNNNNNNGVVNPTEDSVQDSPEVKIKEEDCDDNEVNIKEEDCNDNSNEGVNHTEDSIRESSENAVNNSNSSDLEIKEEDFSNTSNEDTTYTEENIPTDNIGDDYAFLRQGCIISDENNSCCNNLTTVATAAEEGEYYTTTNNENDSTNKGTSKLPQLAFVYCADNNGSDEKSGGGGNNEDVDNNDKKRPPASEEGKAKTGTSKLPSSLTLSCCGYNDDNAGESCRDNKENDDEKRVDHDATHDPNAYQQLSQHHTMRAGPTKGRPTETPQSLGNVSMTRQSESQPGRPGMAMGPSQPSQQILAHHQQHQQRQHQQLIRGSNCSKNISDNQNVQPPASKDIGVPPQQQQLSGVRQPLEFDHAINYVTTIKERFADEPETYKKFLEILHRKKRDLKEQRDIKELLEEVFSLFEEHSDLLKEFSLFLPDAIQSEAKEQLEIVVKEAEERRTRKLAAATKQKSPQPRRKQYVSNNDNDDDDDDDADNSINQSNNRSSKNASSCIDRNGDGNAIDSAKDYYKGDEKDAVFSNGRKNKDITDAGGYEAHKLESEDEDKKSFKGTGATKKSTERRKKRPTPNDRDYFDPIVVWLKVKNNPPKERPSLAFFLRSEQSGNILTQKDQMQFTRKMKKYLNGDMDYLKSTSSPIAAAGALAEATVTMDATSTIHDIPSPPEPLPPSAYEKLDKSNINQNQERSQTVGLDNFTGKKAKAKAKTSMRKKEAQKKEGRSQRPKRQRKQPKYYHLDMSKSLCEISISEISISSDFSNDTNNRRKKQRTTAGLGKSRSNSRSLLPLEVQVSYNNSDKEKLGHDDGKKQCGVRAHEIVKNMKSNNIIPNRFSEKELKEINEYKWNQIQSSTTVQIVEEIRNGVFDAAINDRSYCDTDNFTGVSPNRTGTYLSKKNPWRASIFSKYIGCFEKKQYAARAVEIATKMLYATTKENKNKKERVSQKTKKKSVNQSEQKRKRGEESIIVEKQDDAENFQPDQIQRHISSSSTKRKKFEGTAESPRLSSTATELTCNKTVAAHVDTDTAVDPVLMEFVVKNKDCFKVPPVMFHEWLVEKWGVASMPDLDEACQEEDFVFSAMWNGGGLKPFKKKKFITAVIDSTMGAGTDSLTSYYASSTYNSIITTIRTVPKEGKTGHD